jgi:hypothetical protein
MYIFRQVDIQFEVFVCVSVCECVYLTTEDKKKLEREVTLILKGDERKKKEKTAKTKVSKENKTKKARVQREAEWMFVVGQYILYAVNIFMS